MHLRNERIEQISRAAGRVAEGQATPHKVHRVAVLHVAVGGIDPAPGFGAPRRYGGATIVTHNRGCAVRGQSAVVRCTGGSIGNRVDCIWRLECRVGMAVDVSDDDAEGDVCEDRLAEARALNIARHGEPQEFVIFGGPLHCRARGFGFLGGMIGSLGPGDLTACTA